MSHLPQNVLLSPLFGGMPLFSWNEAALCPPYACIVAFLAACALLLLFPSGSSPALSSPGVELQLHFVLELVWASPAPLLAPLSAPAQWEQAALLGSDLSLR